MLTDIARSYNVSHSTINRAAIPPATSKMQQVRVRVRVLKGLGDRFDYLFDEGKTTSIPEFGEEPIHDELKQTLL